MNKEDKILLLTYTFIGVVAAGVTGWYLCQNRQDFWRTQARSAFRMALQEEMRKWKDIDVFYYTAPGTRRLSDDSIYIKKAPMKVSLTSEYGKKDFLIPYEKYSQNIEEDSEDTRFMHTYLLHESPLNADSLNLFWKRRLAKMNFSETTVVRMVVSDWWEHESYTYSADSLYVSKSDSLSTYYIGCRCEVEVTGYLYYPWWRVLVWIDWVLLVALIAGCVLLFFLQRHISNAYHRFFVKEKEVKVPVIIEKEVPVVADRESRPHIYPLEEGVCFDADSRLLKKGDESVKLTPLPAKLLQGLLDAEGYRLSNEEILQLLWANGTGTSDRLHQNTKRLRTYLSQISVCTLENENFSYRLNIPVSSEKSPSK